MRSFILGVVITLAVLIIGGLGAALLGFIPTNANATPPKVEEHIAMGAVDAFVDKHGSHANSPVSPSPENLIDGMKLYTMNCAVCHGALDKKPSTLANSFYPPPPQLVQDPPADPDWHNYFVIRNGIRYTGMPAWDKTLSDEDLPLPHGKASPGCAGLLEECVRRTRSRGRSRSPRPRRPRQTLIELCPLGFINILYAKFASEMFNRAFRDGLSRRGP
jgi:mono/diheme cytochrome c family protein